MRKVGKVINIEKNKVYILTKDKEFFKVKKHEIEPIVGELYAGEVIPSKSSFKLILFVFIILLGLFLSRGLYTYYTTKFSIVVDMNSSIKLEVNAWNKVISTKGISAYGRSIVKSTRLKHKSLNTALNLILDKSVEEKYLTKAHAADGKRITIFVLNNEKNISIHVDEFKKHAATYHFKVLVNNNGNGAIE